jgi:hypothetical protein
MGDRRGSGNSPALAWKSNPWDGKRKGSRGVEVLPRPSRVAADMQVMPWTAARPPFPTPLLASPCGTSSFALGTPRTIRVCHTDSPRIDGQPLSFQILSRRLRRGAEPPAPAPGVGGSHGDQTADLPGNPQSHTYQPPRTENPRHSGTNLRTEMITTGIRRAMLT